MNILATIASLSFHVAHITSGVTVTTSSRSFAPLLSRPHNGREDEGGHGMTS